MSDTEPALSIYDPNEWRRSLVTSESKSGNRTLRKVVANAITILGNDPGWCGAEPSEGSGVIEIAASTHVLAYDEFAERVVRTRTPPWHDHDAPQAATRRRAEPPVEWTEEDTTRTQAWLSRAWGLDLGAEVVYAAVLVVARRTTVHPVRDYLLSLSWDHGERAETWLHDYLGAPDTPYVRAVGVCWLVAAVARVMRPGCKVDTMLVLEGAQGAGKSTALRFLAGDAWHVELTGDLSARDVAMQLRSKWIVELGELSSLRRSAIEQVKSFLTRTTDNYRPPYGRMARDFPRQCVMAGTTNAEEYLHDETGARRFWPVRVSGAAALRELARDRDQLWAEAVRLYDAGARWFLSDTDLRAAAEAETSDRFAEDAWTHAVLSYAQAPTRAAGVTVADVFTEALKSEIARLSRADEMRIASILKRAGFSPVRSRENGVRVRRYARACPDRPNLPNLESRSGRVGIPQSSQAITQPTQPMGIAHVYEGEGKHAASGLMEMVGPGRDVGTEDDDTPHAFSDLLGKGM